MSFELEKRHLQKFLHHFCLKSSKCMSVFIFGLLFGKFLLSGLMKNVALQKFSLLGEVEMKL